MELASGLSASFAPLSRRLRIAECSIDGNEFLKIIATVIEWVLHWSLTLSNDCRGTKGHFGWVLYSSLKV